MRMNKVIIAELPRGFAGLDRVDATNTITGNGLIVTHIIYAKLENVIDIRDNKFHSSIVVEIGEAKYYKEAA